MEARLLEAVQRLSHNFDDKINQLTHKLDELKPTESTNVSPRLAEMHHEVTDERNATHQLLVNLAGQLRNMSTTNEQRLATLGNRLERLPATSGIYFMQPDPSRNVSFEVLRDWTNNHGYGGNWIVFQHRFDGTVNFYRDWTEYRDGFGDLRAEHWLGLERVRAIVNSRQHELLIVLEDFDGVIAYAHYDDFRLGDESEQYVIKSVGLYTGTAGDSFTSHKDERFSTYDRDNDKHSANCAQSVTGAWWFYKCHHSHLNGEYLRGKLDRQVGIMWNRFRGSYYSLKKTKMMVRPVA